MITITIPLEAKQYVGRLYCIVIVGNLGRFRCNLKLVLLVLATQSAPVLFLLYLAAFQVPKKALPRGPDDLPSSIVPCIWLHCRRPTGSRKQVSIALTCRNIKHHSEAVKRTDMICLHGWRLKQSPYVSNLAFAGTWLCRLLVLQSKRALSLHVSIGDVHFAGLHTELHTSLH